MSAPTPERLTPERLREIRGTQLGDWYAGPWVQRYVEPVGDEPGRYEVVHEESGTVLATLPDWAGCLALFIADAHDAVPALGFEVTRLRAALSAAADDVVERDDEIADWSAKNAALRAELRQHLSRAADKVEKDTLRGESTPATAPVTVYRAEHDAIVMGLYTTAEAARAHCEDELLRAVPGASLDWVEDEEDGVAELVAAFGDDERPTLYVVTQLTAEAEYDPEADA